MSHQETLGQIPLCWNGTPLIVRPVWPSRGISTGSGQSSWPLRAAGLGALPPWPMRKQPRAQAAQPFLAAAHVV